MVPLNREWLQIDQLQRWQLPIVIGPAANGTETAGLPGALKQRNLGVWIDLNGHCADNRRLGRFSMPVLAQLPPLQPLTATALAEQWQQQDLAFKFQQLLDQGQQ